MSETKSGRARQPALKRATTFALAALLGTVGGGVRAQDTGSAGAVPTTTSTAATPATGSASEALSRLAVLRSTLPNGLRVVLNPEPSVPTVAVAVYYDVGSRNEVRGRSGFAHLFEHMMFQGSANVANDEHFALINRRGGSANGTTSEDRTNYYETLPSNDLALGLWLEADRMQSLAITNDNFENQRIVVIQEREQSYVNRPYSLSFLRINELAYGDYWPYSHSTIGDMSDLTGAPLSAVQEFWNSYYAPNNAVVSVAGDFDPEEALRLITEYFGDISAREVIPYAPPEMQPQTAERTDVMYDPHADLAGMHITWHIPPNRADDHYALELLSMVLGDGESSRLYRSLVHEDELLAELSLSTDDRRGPDLFSLFALLAEGHTGEEVRPRIYSAMDAIAREGITARELERVHNRVRTYFLVGLQGNMSRAQSFAEFELYFGDAALLTGELDRYLAVTAADIQRVAGQYFAATNRTVLDVIPQPSEGGAE
jgi:predicted Zn-dependent peptidase